MDIIGAINHSLTLLQRLREVSKNISEAEFKNLLAELSDELADVKLNVVSLKEEILKLKEENQNLKQQVIANTTNKPSMRFGCYTFEGEEGLFCTACYDTKGKKVQTTRINSRYRECPVCKARFH